MIKVAEIVGNILFAVFVGIAFLAVGLIAFAVFYVSPIPVPTIEPQNPANVTQPEPEMRYVPYGTGH